jgi:hypothetical protein
MRWAMKWVMNRATFALLVAAGALCGGCATRYVYGPTGEVSGEAKPPGCTFVLLDAAPTQPFDEIGVLAPDDIAFGDMSGGATPFKEAIATQVCAAGGDAVVGERDDQGRYVRATVIKYREAS